MQFIIILVLFGSSAFASADADLEKGRAKAVTCAACHGAFGISTNSLWPHLAGQNEAYLAKQLSDFKSGARKDPVMSGMTRPLTKEDITNLAAYYSSLR